MNIAILGAGHGGIAMAADLSLAGHQVHLAAVPEHAHNLVMVQALHGINLDGYTSRATDPHSSGGLAIAFARIAQASTDVPAAIRDADVVMVVIPANAQDAYIDLLVEHARPGQVIVFNPVKFGTLVFWQKWKKAGRSEDEVLVGGTESLLYAAKLRGGDHVWIKAVKNTLPFAAHPARRTDEALKKLHEIFSQLTPASNVLEISLDDPGIVIHTVTTLLNTSRIEQMGPYRTGHYDVTPSVGRVIESIDRERQAIAEALGVHSLSVMESMKSMYGVEGTDVCDGMLKIKAHVPQMAPDSLHHRYITEEVPHGLVPIASIADAIGVAVPGIKAIIQVASMAAGMDYTAEGRTVDRLGLAGMTAREMLNFVN